MGTGSGVGWRARAVGVTVLGMVFGSLALVVSPAVAGDAPPTPVTAFQAPLCSGATDDDPRAADPALHHGYTDLTMVDGARLASYNQGDVVPLYDTTGGAQAAYPPLCGTYYDAVSGTAKSVWMFCTDVQSHTCGDIGPGMTLADAGSGVGEMADKTGNPRLNADQEAIIAWLLTHGRDVSFPGFASHADQSSFSTRNALQYLVWCVSDRSVIDSAKPGFCEAHLSAAQQAEILAQVPGTAVVDLALTSSSTPVRIGQQRTINLVTNVFNQPITLNATGTASGTLTVCAGAATLSGNTLTVTGSAPGTSVTVGLCLSPTAAGTYGLSATVAAVQSEEVQWAQADSDCQVYARFRHDAGAPVTDAVSFKVDLRATVAGAPALTTVASAKVVTPGAELFDTVHLTGFRDGHGSKGTAVLYGPLRRVTASSCTPANRFAVVAFTPRNGTVRTPSVRVTRAGYYTWITSTSDDGANKATTHRCGLARETTLVRHRPYRLAHIDAGFSGPIDPIVQRSARPARLTMPATKVDAPVVEVGVSAGRMRVPSAVSTVGRVASSARVGDAIGTVVLAGHVSDRSDRPGALWSLRKARRGQILRYVQGGKVYRYKVTAVQRVSRAKKLPSSLSATTGRHRVVLISCTGKVVRNGRFHYTQNLIVTAVPVR